MHFKVNREELKKVLGLANIACSTNDKDIITSCVLFEVKPSNLTVFSTDKISFTQQTLSVTDVDASFNVLVSVRKLSEICAEYTEDTLDFNYREVDGVIDVQSSIALTAYTDADYPDFREYFQLTNKGVCSTYKKELLNRVFPYVSLFVRNDDRRPEFALTELRQNKFLATDGEKVGIFESSDLKGSWKIPYSVLSGLNKALSYMKDSIQVYTTNGNYIITDTHKFFGFVQSNRQFPAVEERIGKFTSDASIKVDRYALIHAIRKLKIALDGNERFMNFLIADKQMRCSVFNSRGAESRETLPIVFVSGNGSFELSLSFEDVLRNISLFDSPSITCDIVDSKFVILKEIQTGFIAQSVIPVKR